MKTKHIWLIKFWLKWINFYIPIKLKIKGQHLLANNSFYYN